MLSLHLDNISLCAKIKSGKIPLVTLFRGQHLKAIYLCRQRTANGGTFFNPLSWISLAAMLYRRVTIFTPVSVFKYSWHCKSAIGCDITSLISSIDWPGSAANECEMRNLYRRLSAYRSFSINRDWQQLPAIVFSIAITPMRVGSFFFDKNMRNVRPEQFQLFSPSKYLAPLFRDKNLHPLNGYFFIFFKISFPVKNPITTDGILPN